MFFSAKNTWTQVHADVTCNFNTQFEGKKRWVFFPPSVTMLLYPFVKGNNQFFQGGFDLSKADALLEKYPCLRYAQGYETVMEPGDTLWLPSWWWHGIENLSTPSCSVACDGVAWFNKLFGSNFSLSLAFFMHPSNLLDFTLLTPEEIGKKWRI
jgi:ribosomal protein L16 Arg81 hydroxylase